MSSIGKTWKLEEMTDSFWGTQPPKSQPLGTKKPPCSTCYLCFSAVCHIITAVIKHIHHCSLPLFSPRRTFWTHFWKSFRTTSSELTASSAHTAKQWHAACPSVLLATAGCCDMRCVSHHKMTKQSLASPGYLTALQSLLYSRNEKLLRWLASTHQNAGSLLHKAHAELFP